MRGEACARCDTVNTVRPRRVKVQCDETGLEVRRPVCVQCYAELLDFIREGAKA